MGGGHDHLLRVPPGVVAAHHLDVGTERVVPRPAGAALPALNGGVDDHARALPDPFDVGADGDDLAGDVHPGDVGERETGEQRRPLALEHVEAVERGRPHADDDVGRSGHRLRDVDDLEDLRPAEGAVQHGLHRDRPLPSAVTYVAPRSKGCASAAG